MEKLLAVLADYANVTQEGKLNIMGIFGELNPPVLPFNLPQAFLVTLFSAGAAEIGTDKKMRVVLLDGDGKQVVSIEQSVKLPSPKRPGDRLNINFVLGMAGIRFERAGDYAFSILVGDEEKASIPLRVNEVPKGAQQ